MVGLDIGEETIKQNSKLIAKAKTILWNGPQGLTRINTFREGTVRLVDDLIAATARKTVTVAAGGDSIAFISSIEGAESKLSHVSSGRGASTNILEGKNLPGLDHLMTEEQLEVYLKSVNQ